MSVISHVYFLVFSFKQLTAYVMRISDWSSDVCSSDLTAPTSAAQASSWCNASRAAVFTASRHGLTLADDSYIAPAALRVFDPCGPGEIGRASCRERVCQYV